VTDVAIYKILYWQEVPTQIRVEDEVEDVTLMLDGKFMLHVDLLAAKRGLQAADDYLAQWKWSDDEERPGSAREVAEALKAELEAQGLPDIRA
jgi:Virulence factor